MIVELIMVDLNDYPSSSVVQSIIYQDKTEEPHLTLQDAQIIAKHGHKGPNDTFSGFESLQHGGRLDYIFVWKGGPHHSMEVLYHETITDPRDKTNPPSDHRPVMATITLDV